MATEFRIRRVEDSDVFRLFGEAQESGEKAIEALSDGLAQSKPEIRVVFSTALPWQVHPEDIKNASPGEYTLANATLTFALTAGQGGQPPRVEQVTFTMKRGCIDALVDTFMISSSGQMSAMQGEGAQQVQRAIHRKLSTLLQPVAPEDGGLVPTLSNLAASFDTSYRRISKELSDAVKTVNTERAEQLTEFHSERKQLRQEIALERETLMKSAEREIEEQRSKLASEREEIADARSKLEVSSHKDARRKQFMSLQDDLQNALKEPVADVGLRQTRWAVFLALVLSGITSAIFAYFSIASLPSSGTSTASWLFPAIRSLVLTFASLASFLGAAAWLRYFYVRDLQAQEELRRFRNDMARASWVMDAALEIRKEHNEDIPSEWISGVTEGLFSAKTKDTLEEGAQALAALVGLSASASFGPSGTTVELTKKGGKAISAAGKKDT